MRCPKCKGGQGPDRYTQESLAKHLASFHHVTPDVASETEVRDNFVDAINSMIAEADQREANEVLQTTPREEQERAEAVEAVKRLGLVPAMTLSSKLCWSWIATVLLVGLTLVALVLVTKV